MPRPILDDDEKTFQQQVQYLVIDETASFFIIVFHPRKAGELYVRSICQNISQYVASQDEMMVSAAIYLFRQLLQDKAERPERILMRHWAMALLEHSFRFAEFAGDGYLDLDQYLENDGGCFPKNCMHFDMTPLEVMFTFSEQRRIYRGEEHAVIHETEDKENRTATPTPASSPVNRSRIRPRTLREHDSIREEKRQETTKRNRLYKDVTEAWNALREPEPARTVKRYRPERMPDPHLPPQ